MLHERAAPHHASARRSARMTAPPPVRWRSRSSTAAASGGCAARKRQSYTDGVICAKVARYAERIHHPDRLLHPLRRTGPKGSGQFERISWDEALDEIARRFLAIEAEHGAEAVWPYYYAGTMGLVMRDGINRLRHAKRYSGQYSTICTTMAWTGFIAGTGKLAGPDPREMAKSDCVVIWGTNAVHTQVNVMTSRDQGPEGARRQDRRHRHLPQRRRWPRPISRWCCGRAPMPRSPAPSCMCSSATAMPTATISRATPMRPTSWRRISQAARRNGRRRSPACPSRRSRPSRRSSAPARRASSASATASRASATARSRCMRRSACRP